MPARTSDDQGATDSAMTADPLAAILSLLRPRTVQAKVIGGAGAWSIRYAPYEDPAFCLMLEGECTLDAGDLGTVVLRQGDFIFLPRTPAFTLATDLSLTPTLVVPTGDREVRHGVDPGPSTVRMLGGYFQFDRTHVDLLLRLLPPLLHIQQKDARRSHLRRIIELIDGEASADRPGRELILDRLVAVLLIEALRFLPPGSAIQEQGLLAGLADPGLARALRALHAEVAHGWTVAALAKAAFMSRAAFAERFVRVVGMPPMQYLVEWRMAVAKDLLRRERPPLAEVARRVGYQSASAFSTAFSRLMRCSPSAYARAG